MKAFLATHASALILALSLVLAFTIAATIYSRAYERQEEENRKARATEGFWNRTTR